MASLGNFDARKVEPRDDFSPLPEGKYLAAIIASDVKANKAGTGRYLQLTFEILEGSYQGRRLWQRLNLEHPNPKAVELAQADLAQICRAVGVITVRDSDELHNLPLVIHVKCRKRQDTGEIGNEVRGCSAHPRQYSIGLQASL